MPRKISKAEREAWEQLERDIANLSEEQKAKNGRKLGAAFAQIAEGQKACRIRERERFNEIRNDVFCPSSLNR